MEREKGKKQKWDRKKSNYREMENKYLCVFTLFQ